MGTSPASFREFEHAGWSDHDLCAEYDEHLGAITVQSVNALLDAAGVKQGSRVLDVCTGAGYAAGLATERGATAVGVDFSGAQVAVARTRYPKVVFQEADGCALPFPDETFDCVVDGFGLPHFSDPDGALREAFRVLKHQGRLAFTAWDTPDKAVGFGAVYRAVAAHGSMDIGLPQGPNFFLFSNPAECEKRLISAGFGSVLVTTVPQIWRLSSPDEAIKAILHGTVRASATLRGQNPKAWEKIRAAIWDAISVYKRDDKYEVPMPAVLASAMKP